MTSKALSNLINHEAIEATAAAWLARMDNAQAWTEAEERELSAWLDQHLAHRVAWLRLKSTWSRADGLRELEPERSSDAEAAGRVAAARSPATRTRPHRLWAMAAAAIAVLSLGVTVAYQLGSGGSEQFATNVGARQGVTLADGSRVMLNTRTRARVAITRDERKFWLDEGEAFFEIQHDARRPFVLMAGKDRITVLGTKFNVRHEGDRTQVTVVEGRVKLDTGAGSVSQESPANATILTRNEDAIADAGSVLVGAKSPQQTERELSWRAGRLDFDNRPLREIAKEFNRYNRRQLVVDDDAAELMLTGRFDMYNLDGFVRSIQAGFGVVTRTEGDQIRLSSK